MITFVVMCLLSTLWATKICTDKWIREQTPFLWWLRSGHGVLGQAWGTWHWKHVLLIPIPLLSFHTHCQCKVLYATSYYIYAFVTPYGLGCQYTEKMQSLPSPLYTDFTSAGMTLISDQLSLLSSTEQYGILTTYSKPFRHNQPKILIRQEWTWLYIWYIILNIVYKHNTYGHHSDGTWSGKNLAM